MSKKDNIENWKDNLKANSSGFVVPSPYFDSLEDRIMNKVEKLKTPENKKNTNLNNWLFIGVSVAALLLLSVFVFTPEKSISFNGFLQQETSVLEWDQYAMFEESWIVEELEQEFTIQDDMVYQEDDIDFLIDEGITNNEIIEAIIE